MTQTPCPHCGADIDNDSIFCDQCGAELLKCPKCGSFRKGKFCMKCGVATVPAGQAGTQSAQAAPGPQPVNPGPQPVTPGPQPVNPGPQPVSPGPRPVAPDPQPVTPPGPRPTTIPPAQQQPVRITCPAMGVTLMMQPGAIIGRGNGPYTAQLATFQYISGTHARLDFDGMRWTITDIGSRNGTAVNGMPCRVSVPVAIRPGDVIRFATVYDFNVE